MVIDGQLDEEFKLKYVNIELSGFNLDDVKLIYGSTQASGITFNIE